MNSRYQLIKPFISDQIYESSSLMKGAGKCYNEIKDANINNIQTFTIRNIDSNKKYIFLIHPKTNNNQLQIGGNDPIKEQSNPDIKSVQQNQQSEIKQDVKKSEQNLENVVKKLEVRIDILEKILADKYITSNQEKILKCEQKDDICSIM